MTLYEKILTLFFVLLIGIGLGYYWRACQVEPTLIQKIEKVKENQREVSKELTSLEVRIGILEKKNLRRK